MDFHRDKKRRLAAAGVLFFLLNVQAAVLSERTARIEIVAPVRGLAVLMNGMKAGVTPLVLDVEPGTHRFEVVHPDPAGWLTRNWERTVRCAGGDTLKLEAAFPQLVQVVSEPPGAAIHIDGKLQGVTPRIVDLTGNLPASLMLTKRGFSPVTRILTPPLTSPVVVQMENTAEYHVAGGGTVYRRWTWRAAALALAAGLTGYIMRSRADEAYRRYEESANPGEMEDYFRESRFYDRISSACFSLGEVSLGVTVVLAIRGGKTD